jgi:hypothetical protein
MTDFTLSSLSALFSLDLIPPLRYTENISRIAGTVVVYVDLEETFHTLSLQFRDFRDIPVSRNKHVVSRRRFDL